MVAVETNLAPTQPVYECMAAHETPARYFQGNREIIDFAIVDVHERVSSAPAAAVTTLGTFEF